MDFSKSRVLLAAWLGVSLSGPAWPQSALRQLGAPEGLQAIVDQARPAFEQPRMLEVTQAPAKSPMAVPSPGLKKGLDDSGWLVHIKGDQFDKPFLCQATLEKGTGENGLFSSQMLDNFIWKFRRAGARVEFVRVNTGHRAEPGSPGERAVEKSYGDSVVASVPVLSTGPAEGMVTIDPAGIFLQDLIGVGSMVQGAYEGASGQIELEDSRLEFFESYPKNVEIRVHLLVAGTEHPKGPTVLSDPRHISLVLRYSVSDMPGAGYEPRKADPRVGYFNTTYQDWSDPVAKTPYVQLINRWRLEKKDPSAEVSEVKEPIVFWMENTIPHEFRGAVERGILAWNEAFEAIGLKGAIVVKQQPDGPILPPLKDPGFDPNAADTRYNMVRWFIGENAGFAIGPSRVNPLTGEIYNAGVSISGWMARYMTGDFDAMAAAKKSAPGADDAYAAFLQNQAAFGLAALRSRGSLSPEEKKRYMDEYMSHLVMHEIGHDLGLRHNFKGSTYKDIKDMGEGDVAGSVMDYIGVNIAPEGVKQGHYFQVHPGPYDHWAIEYGYKVLASKDEKGKKAELAAVAARSAEPGLAYGTDEDVTGQDPDTQRYDMGKDGLADARNRARLAAKVIAGMAKSAPKGEDGYDDDAQSFYSALGEYRAASKHAAAYIGGLSYNRSLPGDKGATAPYAAVPAAKQREALAFLDQAIFSDKAFRFPPELVARLASARVEGEATGPMPVDRLVLGARAAALAKIYDPGTLRRLSTAASVTPGAMDAAEVFDKVRGSIWSELEAGRNVSSFRRDLQAQHLSILAKLNAAPGLPRDAAAKVRVDLRAIVKDAQAALKSPKLDSATRSHLSLAVHDAKTALQGHEEGRSGDSDDEE